MNDVDQLCINTLRFLSVDAVEKARSGHPGLPLGAAPMAYVLFDRIMRYNPRNPSWFNRDRFILSAGHGCALLYAALHLTGYDLSLDDLKQFRQWGSKTPGHPEQGLTPGIEVTTGPLGQGFGMGVGIAIAERYLAAYFNRPGFPVIDHFTYAIVSDGDLMEGVSSEAASLAGHLRLSKLIYLYDQNHISIEGSTELAFTEDVGKRFEAYGWDVSRIPDGNDVEAITTAAHKARREKDRPSLIIVPTHIGYGSPRQDTAAAHGEPLGPDATRATKAKLGWPLGPAFYIPDEALVHFRKAITRGDNVESEWHQLLEQYRKECPDLAAKLDASIEGKLPEGWEEGLPRFSPQDGPIATRDASAKLMNALAQKIPAFIGGSADLAPSTKTSIIDAGDFSADKVSGRNLHFGVREHAMGTIVNGMAMHGGIVPYGATFLVFSDYMRPSLRIASIMKAHSIFVFTHDSIGLGEDGPTHQPVEHLMSLRAMPGMTVIRPGDANETVAAWQLAIARKGPTAIVLTRQKIPVMPLDKYPIIEGALRGAYILADADKAIPDIILIASGSEVQLILAAREKLAGLGVQVRAVSIPSWEVLDEQSSDYIRSVLPADVPKLAVESGATLGWCKYVGENGAVIGLNRFGASGPGNVVMSHLGFTADHVVEHALRLLGR